MPLSAQDSLTLARANIEQARTASSDQDVIRHYRAAKSALDKVDVTRTDNASLEGMITAFQDLAVVLDHSKKQEKAAKCRQRAEGLR